MSRWPWHATLVVLASGTASRATDLLVLRKMDVKWEDQETMTISFREMKGGFPGVQRTGLGRYVQRVFLFGYLGILFDLEVKRYTWVEKMSGFVAAVGESSTARLRDWCKAVELVLWAMQVGLPQGAASVVGLGRLWVEVECGCQAGCGPGGSSRGGAPIPNDESQEKGSLLPHLPLSLTTSLLRTTSLPGLCYLPVTGCLPGVLAGPPATPPPPK
eukprot:Sspe_Gene.106436::Locus_84382_Transcript_1_1_Confidence_1.000_Length_743::g.106436::m.106436